MSWPSYRKFNNQPVIVEGRRFPSKAEGKRYEELRRGERAGVFRDLTCQPRFPIVINGQKVCDYVADFKYYDVERNREVIEDVKGMKTPIYNLKKKLVLAVLGIEIIEIS